MESIGRFSLVGASVVAVMAVVAGCSDAPSTGDAATKDKASNTSTPTPSPTPDPVLTSAPTGEWTMTSTVVKVRGDQVGGIKVGDTEVSTWKFRPSCEVASDCGGRIRTSSKTRRTYVWDGTTLTVTRVSPELTSESWCNEGDGGARIPGTTVPAKVTYTNPLVLRGMGGTAAGGVPTSFDGKFKYAAHYTFHDRCNDERLDGKEIIHYEMTMVPGAAPKN